MLSGVLVFLCLVTTVMGCLAGFLCYDKYERLRVLGEVAAKKEELIKLVEAVTVSHNALNEAHVLMDQKITELGLRLSQMGAPQAKGSRGFPSL